jgi:ferredoxin--NADP+ reductase
MIWELLRGGHHGPILAACCVRFRRDLAYLAVHEELMRRYRHYTYVSLTTREADTVHQKVYIQDLIESGELERRLRRKLDPAHTHVYLCGNPKMIGVPTTDRKTGQRTYPKPLGVVEILERKGFRIDQPSARIEGTIHVEEYW